MSFLSSVRGWHSYVQSVQPILIRPVCCTTAVNVDAVDELDGGETDRDHGDTTAFHSGISVFATYHGFLRKEHPS